MAIYVNEMIFRAGPLGCPDQSLKVMIENMERSMRSGGRRLVIFLQVFLSFWCYDQAWNEKKNHFFKVVPKPSESPPQWFQLSDSCIQSLDPCGIISVATRYIYESLWFRRRPIFTLEIGERMRDTLRSSLEPRLLRLQCLLPLLHQMSLQESWRHQIQGGHFMIYIYPLVI